VKFWEAVALALVLGAGIVSWVYVQDTANAKSNLRNSLRSVQDAFTVSDTKNAIRLEAAVTRASMGRDLPVGTLDNYAYAWNSPEVRDAWLKRTENEVRNLANILFVIRGAEERHRLNEHTTNLAEQVAELRSELGRIVEALGGEAGAEGALSFTGSDAGDWGDKIGPIYSALVALMNETTHRLAEKATTRAWIYQGIFILGSTLLVGVRIMEWRSERSCC
jgi:hypothetical protein